MPMWLDSDNALDRLLGGNPLEIFPKVEKSKDHALFTPTPFTPTKQTYIARFSRNKCAVCGGISVAFEGFFLEKSDEKGARDMIFVKPRDMPQEERRKTRLDITDETQPTCLPCFLAFNATLETIKE